MMRKPDKKKKKRGINLAIPVKMLHREQSSSYGRQWDGIGPWEGPVKQKGGRSINIQFSKAVSYAPFLKRVLSVPTIMCEIHDYFHIHTETQSLYEDETFPSNIAESKGICTVIK